ncbi:MAG: fatty acid desaturase [Flavobacteriales bacterium]|nr:fatty acid desaturase [Flavobacteriales bacterium]
MGWILGPDYKHFESESIKDFTKFKELVWLNSYHLVPPLILLVVVWLSGNLVNGGSVYAFEEGLSTMLIGFTLSTAILFHGTFSINSVMHYFGKARYETGDESKNHLLLALITLGEGWHNNHHYYQSASRQGFFWWEIDITFYILKILSFFGLVWDLRGVPDHIKYSKNIKHAKQLAKENRSQA